MSQHEKVTEHRTITVLKGKNKFIAVVGGYEIHAATAEEVKKRALEFIKRDPIIADALEKERERVKAVAKEHMFAGD